MRFLIETVYCMTWIWTLHRANNKLKSPIKEDNIWARLTPELKVDYFFCMQVDKNVRHDEPFLKQSYFN